MSELDQASQQMNQQVQASTSPLPPSAVVTTPSTNQSNHRDDGQSSNRTSTRRGHRSRSRSSSRRSRNRSSRHSSSAASRNDGRLSSSCRIYCKRSERNFGAAACSMISIVLLSTALEPEWITLSGGRCHKMYDAPGTLTSLSTNLFFYNGRFYKNYALNTLTDQSDTVYKYGPEAHNFLVSCITFPVLLSFKSCIACTLIAIIMSFCAFLLNLVSHKNPLLWMLRHNSVFNIITVLLCTLINLLTYWITEGVDKLQQQHLLHDGSKVEVTFGASFYIITTAGIMSVVATGCNCLESRVPQQHSESCSHRSHDHSYFDDTEALLSQLSSEEGQQPLSASSPPLLIDLNPAPPEYTPQ